MPPTIGKYRNMSRDQIKASLFTEVQEIRNKLYKADPTLSLCISDTQIRRNIDKKLDYFLKCREYAETKIENYNANSAYLNRDKFKPYSSTIRGIEESVINKNNIKAFEYEVNSEDKRNYLHDKTIGEILNQDYQQVLGLLSDPEKALDFTLKHRFTVEAGFTVGVLAQTGLDIDTENFISENKSIFESPFVDIGNMNALGASPVSFLYQDTLPSKDAEEFSKLNLAMAKAYPQDTTGYAFEKPRQAINCIGLLALVENEKKIYDELIKRGITNVLEYKPKDPTKSLSQVLINGGELVKRPQEEIDYLNEEFSKYEMAVFKDKYTTPKENNPLTSKQLAKYNDWKKTHDFSQIYERVERDKQRNKEVEEAKKNKSLKTNYKDLYNAFPPQKNIVNEESHDLQKDIIIDRPMSPEEIEKQQLFEKAVEMRDLINGNRENKIIKTTDEEIKQNIADKYELYKFSRDFFKASEENRANCKQAFDEKGLKDYSLLRGADHAATDKEHFNEYFKENSSEIKAKHYSMKQIEKLAKFDIHKVYDALNDPKKIPDFVNENRAICEIGFSTSAILLNAHVSKPIMDQMAANKVYYEEPFCDLKEELTKYSNPLSMLYPGSRPDWSDETKMQVYEEATKHFMSNEKYEEGLTGLNNMPSCVSKICSMTPPTNNKRREEALKFNGKKITDLTKYTAVDKGVSLQNALIEGKPIREKTAQELKELQDEFNLYDMAYLKDKMENPENSPSISYDEEKQYNNFVKSGAKDPYEVRKNSFNYKDNYISLYARVSRNRQNDRDRQIMSLVDLKAQYDKKSLWQKFLTIVLPNQLTETGRLKDQISDMKKNLKETINLRDEEIGLYENVRDAIANGEANMTRDDFQYVAPNEPKEPKPLDLNENTRLNSMPEYASQMQQQQVLQQQQTMDQPVVQSESNVNNGTVHK